jgi:hypothetical protein
VFIATNPGVVTGDLDDISGGIVPRIHHMMSFDRKDTVDESITTMYDKVKVLLTGIMQRFR